MRLAVRLTRGIAFAVAWLVSLALAGGVGWSLGLYEGRRPEARHTVGTAQVPAAAQPVLPARPDPRSSASAAPVEPPDGRAAEDEQALPPTPAPAPSPTPAIAKKRTPASTPPPPAAAEPDPPPAEPPADLAPVEPEPTVARGATLERARAVERLAEADDLDRAKREAAALLGEHETYTELTSALVADGADAARAQLIAVRLLQLAGEDTASRQLARELRRSYSATADIAESIRRWGILSPRILSSTPSIDGGQLVVAGELENPDVGRVRRLKIQVEALDAGGNRLSTVEARVRPSVIEPGDRAAFTATFKKLDPSTVLRTRASVVEWESEMVGRAAEPAPRSTETAD